MGIGSADIPDRYDHPQPRLQGRIMGFAPLPPLADSVPGWGRSVRAESGGAHLEITHGDPRPIDVSPAPAFASTTGRLRQRLGIVGDDDGTGPPPGGDHEAPNEPSPKELALRALATFDLEGKTYPAWRAILTEAASEEFGGSHQEALLFFQRLLRLQGEPIDLEVPPSGRWCSGALEGRP